LLASALEQGKCAEGHNPGEDLIAGSSPPFHYSYHCTLKSKSGLQNPLPVKGIFNILKGKIWEGLRISFTMYRDVAYHAKLNKASVDTGYTYPTLGKHLLPVTIHGTESILRS
jgi:hypothetical protein